MTPFYSDDWLTLYGGDCREVLRELPSDSVDCVVTSPPYWGLRDYGAEGQLGLERTPEEYVANMVAVFREVQRVLKPSGTCWLNLGDSFGPQKQLVGIPWRVAFALQADGWFLRSDVIWSKPNPMPESVTDRPTKSHEYLFLLAKGQWKSRVVELSDRNRKRGHLRDDFGPDGAYSWAGELSVRLATAILDRPEFKDQLGLSPLDPKVGEQGAEGRDSDAIGGLPVEHRAAVWASRLLGADCTAEQFLSELHGLGVALSNRHNLRIGGSPTEVPLPPGVYAYGQTAIAIEHPGEVRQFDFLHNQIIQSAPSTCSYYFDADAVREPHKWQDEAELAVNAQARQQKRLVEREAWRDQGEYNAAMRGEREKGRNTTDHKSERAFRMTGAGRNIRSVWNIATRPYPGAHFAVFPPELPERCIKAGSSERGVCPECGAPWERMTQTARGFTNGKCHGCGRPRGQHVIGGKNRGKNSFGLGKSTTMEADGAVPCSASDTLGWRPTCDHWECADCGRQPAGEPAGDDEDRPRQALEQGSEAPSTLPELRASLPAEGPCRQRGSHRPRLLAPSPSVVLDCFGGSGTVGMVANRLSRRAILIDLNPEYLKQQMKRNAQTPLGLGAAL